MSGNPGRPHRSRVRRNALRLIHVMLLTGSALTQQSAPVEPDRAPLRLTSPVQDKNFYLLSIIERSPDVKLAVERDISLGAIAAAKRESLTNAAKDCKLDLSCYAAALKWTDAEIATVSEDFRKMYAQSPAVKRMVDGPLRASGVFVRYGAKAGDEMLADGWADSARGVNHVIDVYGKGAAPRYPEIDSVSFDVKSDAYRRLVQVIVTVLEDDRASQGTTEALFFQPSLRFALALMDANHRDEAGRFEPLETGENAAALRHVQSVPWDRYPYSVIVVPGAGADRVSWSLSPYAKIRAALAAKRYREGKAPFILVSGGFVHPNQTPYCEAIEMKKSLISDFGIPAEAILVDPHARHTTTNLRNAVREMYRYNFPLDKKALITSDPGQSHSIEDAAFKMRCLKELGYEPVSVLGRVSLFDLEFLPRIDSLQIDPLDPLDP
jgi:hypothetical protein